MNRRPLHFITREKEWELIQKLLTIVDSTDFHPADTAVLMVSPDYSATVAMHLAHAWSRSGEMLPVIAVDVPYPDEDKYEYQQKLLAHQMEIRPFTKLVLVEAGIIRGGNWGWLLESLKMWGFTKNEITTVAMCENVHSRVKSDYVGEYYNDDDAELMFYFERFNKHWPIK